MRGNTLLEVCTDCGRYGEVVEVFMLTAPMAYLCLDEQGCIDSLRFRTDNRRVQ